MIIPKIEEIIAVAIFGYQSGKVWGSVCVEFKFEGEIYYKLIDFQHHEMRIFWTHGSFHYPFISRNGVTKIYEPDFRKVLRGDYDHVKITPLQHREKLGIVSNILKEILEDDDD